MPVSTADVDQLHRQIQRRLVESGEWDRIKSSFKAKLNETGWTDDFQDISKETARDMDPISFRDLLNELSPRAHTTIPLPVRREVMAIIQKYLEKQFE
ncbi:enhancer of yellow 2 transcription factor-like protein [Moniliophthora roreri MCA 2997]|uniref:Transcription and mRNA export factor SUS1 n=1 Tax=Moniliophthora roreri (strain MCA 2997) TaxID=1381753 RepID=V2X0N1_MONRO|nr:enhancer of yellow 2 transcription factor-like protein [Moniliophthora roreri MCA 2997]KAI3614012.1 enhancer of yellow 2 transcription factor-like protein [Moniliophthora roreri]